jgi:HEAT repeat protein
MSEAATAVRWLLQQAEPEARRVAVQQIAKVAGAEASDLLLRALGDEDWRVRKEAAVIAPALEQRDDAVRALVGVLKEMDNIGLRNAAVEALVAIGPDAVGPTVEILPRLDADARKLAVEVLGGVADLRSALALAGALEDEDPNVRAAAAEALGNVALAGEEACELASKSLVRTLATRDTLLKIAALESLARLKVHLPWSIFEPHANDALLRRYAIAGARASREPNAVRALARATGDTSATVASEAIAALGDLVAATPRDEALLEVAREELRALPSARINARRSALDSEDGRARSGALPLLGLLGELEDVPLLVGALGEDVAERAHLGLQLLGAQAVEPVLAAARVAAPQVRAAAIELVASLPGTDEAELRIALRGALDDVSPEVSACAIDALGHVGDANDLARVVGVASHADERVAAAVRRAIWQLAAKHVGAARALLAEASLASSQAELGCTLLGAIGSVQKLHEDEIRVLERALAHDLPQVRCAAIEALAQLGGDAAADAVVFALADEEHDVQLAAVRALGQLGRAEPLANLVADTRDAVLAAAAFRALGDADPSRAVAAACPLVTHSDAALACAAVEAIGLLALGRASTSVATACEDALFRALDHEDVEVVKLALSLVGTQPGARALARLGLCLDHPSWDVRRMAAELLGHSQASGSQALLRARYEREREPLVRDAIASAVSLRPARGDDAGMSVIPHPKEGG